MRTVRILSDLYLSASLDLISRRLAAQSCHFIPAALLRL